MSLESTAGNPGRRAFLKTAALAAGSALVVSFTLPQRAFGAASVTPASGGSLTAFIRIATDGAVTLTLGKAEMGQGVHTGLAQLLADELEAPWQALQVEHAPALPAYAGPGFPMMITGGSTSIAACFVPLRTAAAAAREMLVAEAASRWNVPAGECTAMQGVVKHGATARQFTYGELAAAAGQRPVPEKPALKPRSEWRYIGQAMPRVDSAAKSRGETRYGIDVRRPGQRYAQLARPPRGGRITGANLAAARAVPGVTDVFEIPQGIAVVATNTWAASQGRSALQPKVVIEQEAGFATAALAKQYHALARQPGQVARAEGDLAKATANATQRVEADYAFPYLAHAPMEPLNCTAMVTPEGVQLWLGTQGQTFDQMAAARAAGVRPDQVTIETCMLGGGFGRRASVAGDNVAPAVEIAKRLPGLPVQLVWTREDDLTDGFYRPQAHHHVVVELGADGFPLSWQHTVVGQPLVKGTPLERAMMNPKTGIEVTLTEGIDNLPYAVPVVHVQVHSTSAKVPVQWWRSVGSTHTSFALECCIDECARAAKQDPVAYRLALLKDSPKEKRALEMAAAKAGWGTPLPKGRARGVAVVSSFGSTVAQVAEVSVVDGQPRVHRVVAVMDCGTVVNPGLVEQQVQSAIAYGLSAALREEITFAADQVEQTNFHAYRPLRLHEMPVVEVHLVESTEPPTGVGEPGTPPIGPAVANALRALTGEAVRQLPFSRRSWS